MNREFLLEAVLGVTAGLLFAVLAVHRTATDPKPGVLRRGGMAAVLVYAVLAGTVLVGAGMTLWGVLMLLVLVCLPMAGMLRAAGRPSLDGEAVTWVRRIVAIGLCAAMLVAAGRTLSLLGLLDPRALVVVVAAVTALLVAQQGLAASSRIGSLAMWLLIVPILVALALGLLLGDFGQAVDPIIHVPGPSAWEVLALAVAFLALGWADAGLATSHADGGWAPLRVLGGVLGVILLVSLGLLMFFGGAIRSPSMDFLLVPANLDALPGLAGLMLAILTVVFAALVAAPLTGLRSRDGSWRWVAIGGAISVVVALLGAGLDQIVVATSLAAASIVGARATRGVLVGLTVAAVAVVVLAVTGDLGLGWPAALAVLVVAGAGAVPPPASVAPGPGPSRVAV